MTDLIPDQHRIIEIVTRVIDSDLKLLAEGPVIAVRRPEHELAKMDDLNVRQHGQSGLSARVRTSTIGEAEADALTIEFLIAVPGSEHRQINLVIDQPVQRVLESAGPNLLVELHWQQLRQMQINWVLARHRRLRSVSIQRRDACHFRVFSTASTLRFSRGHAVAMRR